jgi:hypothetical protein
MRNADPDELLTRPVWLRAHWTPPDLARLTTAAARADMRLMTIAPPREPGAGEAAAASTGHTAAPPEWRRRVGRVLDPVAATKRSWALHLLLLAAILGGLLAFVGNGQVMDADEGAAMAQAQILNHTGHWALPATSQLDPTGRWFPIHLSGRIGHLEYVFTRPPIYPAVLAPLDRWGGLTLILLVHLAALLVAAWGVGLLVERVRPGRGIQALWFTAVLSPLLFDGFWVIAHSIAAAGAMWAAYSVVRVVLDRRWRWLPIGAVGLAIAVTFRNEALIFCVALAVGTVALGARDRARTALPLAAGTVAIGLAGYKGMTLYARAVQGGSSSAAYKPTLGGGLITGRISGFEHSILSAGSGGQLGITLVIAVAALLIAAMVAVRFELAADRVVRELAIGAAALAIVRAVALPIDLVTGMLMAGPALVAAFLLPTEARRDPVVRFASIVAALTFLGVMATESQAGGSGEWGGRYFHVALPLVCALAVVAFDGILARRGQIGRTVVGAAVVVCLALSVLALREAATARQTTQTLTETAWTTALSTRTAHDPGGPVIVSSWVAGGRFSWQHLLDGRYLTVEHTADFPALGRSLKAANVADFVFLGEHPAASQLGQIGSGYRVTKRIPLGTHGWTVDVISRS